MMMIFKKLFLKRKCAEVQSRVQMYLDSELDETTAAKIADHLEMCEDCSFEADFFARIKYSLQKSGSAVAPDTLNRLNAFANGLTEDAEPAS